MYAVVRLNGFQYLAQVGSRHSVQRLDAESGQTVKLDDVLLVGTGEEVMVGFPRVEKASVEARVVDHTRNDKITIGKFIRRENYRRLKGHRQPMTEIEIVRIDLAG